MRITLVVTMIMLLCGSVFAGPRLVIGESAFITAGPEKTQTYFNTKVGFSTEIPGLSTERSAVYSITMGKYGEGGVVKGGDQEFAFFPIRPTGSGFRLFFLAGGNVTILDEADPITYLQFTSGMGAYWDVSEKYALWLAFKLETAQELTTAQIGFGLSTTLF